MYLKGPATGSFSPPGCTEVTTAGGNFCLSANWLVWPETRKSENAEVRVGVGNGGCLHLRLLWLQYYSMEEHSSVSARVRTRAWVELQSLL